MADLAERQAEVAKALEALEAGKLDEALQAVQELQAEQAAELAQAIQNLPQLSGQSGPMAQASQQAQQGSQQHGLGARITLEESGGTAPFAITCGIYGWMMHTHFVSDRAAADRAFNDMKYDLGGILNQIPLDDDPNAGDEMERVSELISDFVSRFR